MSSSIHSFADDTFLSSSFSFNPNDHASIDIQLHRNISASLLSNDLTVIEKWGKDNLVSFNQSKTKQAVISRKRSQNFPAVFMNGDELDISASFTQLGLSLSSNLTWKTHIHSLAKHASIYIQVPNPSFFRVLLPRLELCSKSTLLDKVQSKAIRLINNPNPTKSLQPLSHRRLVRDHYSSSSEACQDHQKLNSFTPFPSFTANSISRIIIHPKNMQLMERLAFFLLS